MYGSLKGKTAIVTGGGRGIGATIAILFAERGCTGVAITYVSNDEAAKSVVSKIEAAGAKGVAIKADMADPAAPAQIVKTTMEAFSSDGIDILVNNAATAHLVPLLDASMDDFSKVFDTNFRGPALMIKAVIPVIRKGGRIINVSSRGAKTSAGGPMALYCASKAALHSITKSVSNEFGVSKGITCNTLMPGHTDTDMMSGSTDSDYRKWAESLPTSEKRLGTTDDMAQIAGWLAAEESRWINGDTISATGGSWMP